MTKIIDRLSDRGELWKLHVKHHHMNTENFKRRTKYFKLPKNIYDLYDGICKSCDSCQKFCQAPQRSKVSGMRAENFGDLVFIDHVELSWNKHAYIVLIIVDAASNLIWAKAQKNKEHDESLKALVECQSNWNVRFRALCADAYFAEESTFMPWYRSHGIRFLPLGPHTPWPNRAEAAVKVFKHPAQILADWLINNESDVPGIKSVTVWHVITVATEARNSCVTYGGVTPLEIAFGRKPPDVIDVETMNPEQLSQAATPFIRRDREAKSLRCKPIWRLVNAKIFVEIWPNAYAHIQVLISLVKACGTGTETRTRYAEANGGRLRLSPSASLQWSPSRWEVA